MLSNKQTLVLLMWWLLARNSGIFKHSVCCLNARYSEMVGDFVDSRTLCIIDQIMAGMNAQNVIGITLNIISK